MSKISLSVIIIPEGTSYVAQCLEKDITAQGTSIQKAIKNFKMTLAGWIISDIEESIEPLSKLPEAPKMYLNIFLKSQSISKKINPFFPPNTPAPKIDFLADDVRVAPKELVNSLR